MRAAELAAFELDQGKLSTLALTPQDHGRTGMI
jgi:hypothetical protein